MRNFKSADEICTSCHGVVWHAHAMHFCADYLINGRRYVTAWNNLGDAFEKATKIKEAFNSYSEALSYAPDNKVASARVQALRTKLDRYSI